MEKGDSVEAFCSKIAQIRDQLRVTGVTIDDDDLVQAIYDGLPPSSWESFLSSITGRSSQPTFESLWHDCLEEESRILTRERPPKEDHLALSAKFKRRGRRPFPHRNPQKNIQKENPNPGFRGKKFDMSKVKCYNCDKIGHFSKDCRGKKKGNFNKEKHYASTVQEENPSGSPPKQEKRKEYYLVSALTGSVITSQDTWLVDSGASTHMTRYRKVLSDFRKKSCSTQMELRDVVRYEVNGVGSISLHLESGAILHLEEVLYVPSLKKNLISVSVLENKGYSVLFFEKKALLWQRGLPLKEAETIGVQEGGLYKVPRQLARALTHNQISTSELWHRRLGHLNYRALPNLQSMVSGMPSITCTDFEVCKGCMIGKNTKKSFSNSTSRAKEILELVHSDICGPMSCPSLNGFLYYVIFIDDYFRK